MVAEEEARCSAMGPNEVLVMGVRNILSTTTDAAQARAAAENLFNLVAAIASDPGEPRLRALRASNKDFQVPRLRSPHRRPRLQEVFEQDGAEAAGGLRRRS
eukprot:GHVU01219705.1.p3 GENE.GHVU01219705.1~~GHVU01219705.1.p3  ORF type:complete len:102 (-),score=19.63 GHVU01219705.1:517-822(-)